MMSFVCKENLKQKLGQKMIKIYILAVLLYVAVTWRSLKATAIHRLEALEMWLHTRMLRIPWTARQYYE